MLGRRDIRYVNIIIFYFYVVGIWQIIILRHQSRLGNFKIHFNHRAVAYQPHSDGCGWIDVSRFSDFDRSGNHFPLYFPDMIFAYTRSIPTTERVLRYKINQKWFSGTFSYV